MSIVDAIERAKQMGRERAAATTGQRPAPAPATDHSVPVRTAVHDTSGTDRMAALPAMEVQALAYDVLVCAENHIIVPDADPQMAQPASPPYRMLRTRILQRCRANRWSTLAVTSPGPGEGKSVSALNLAISIAREGSYDVFLIDLDMRNPSISRYLGVSPRVDVTEYFQGKASVRDIWFSLGIDRLTLTGSVTGTGHASELLATSKLEEMLAFVRQSVANPLIILDLPPVVNTDDALVVAPRVDATVLVVSEGVTRREALERALGLLSEYPLAGIVLNKSHDSIGSEYYGN